MKLTEIYWHLRSDIGKIEQALEKTIEAEHPVLRDASTHLLKAGGKRIRPVFVLLSAQFGNYDLNRIQQIAVPLELIHMASLVHDDVIDDADLRRGKETVKAKWDNRVAMYSGDYIFARAIEMATYCEQSEVHLILANAMKEMSIGEVEQIRDQYNEEQDLRKYLRRIKRKTALLIAVSCQLGAVVAEAKPNVQKQLYWFGYYVGMAYQVTDDILDFIGTEKELGKPAGSDLQQGNLTLPALYGMRRDDTLKQWISEHFRHPYGNHLPIDDVIARVKQNGAIADSQKLARQYLQKAFLALEQLPNTRAKKSLRQIGEYIEKRNS
ncbi:heptaprenyl diphosphate synthase component II [Texcoconibacillus texcoconensis]|uniref:Heptaprenyl diphosphate synthase component 2 n=1 Tax=Texcoconibacillus texcoconensis TaxID=1095777 RepID=A0A840QND2_9BACI|nr:heptaprenyl diphosphate synthase component II [Texcoconibacillus texcoconensis]MBB5172892.1 heptaprenyl diphosphate synthase [Texcoconibacillus texcoconensis]